MLSPKKINIKIADINFTIKKLIKKLEPLKDNLKYRQELYNWAANPYLSGKKSQLSKRAQRYYVLLIKEKNKVLALENKINNQKNDIKELKNKLKEHIRVKKQKAEERKQIRQKEKEDKQILKKLELEKQKELEKQNNELIRMIEDINKPDFKELNLMSYDVPIKKALYAICSLRLTEPYVITINNTGWTLNNSNRHHLADLISETLTIVDTEVKSDQEMIKVLNLDINVAKLESLKHVKAKQQDNGAFFNKYNNTKIDLTKLGIYTKDVITVEKLNENCLIKCLNELNCDELVIQNFKLKIMNNNIPRHVIKKLCEENDITIKVTTETQTFKYGTKGNVYCIYLLNNHYFIKTNIDISKTALVNYFELIKNEDFNKFKNKKDKKGHNNVQIDSFKIVKYMLTHKDYFIDMTVTDITLKSLILDKLDNELEILEYNESLCTKINEYKTRDPKLKLINKANEENMDDIDKELEEYKEPNVIHCDFETHLNEQNKHIQDTLCYAKTINNEIVTYAIHGENCGQKFLKTLTEDTILIFHNASYDFTFLIKDLFGDSLIMKSKKLILGNFLYTNNKKTIKIKILDSLAMIPEPLHKFGTMFKLEQEKEVISHNYYNHLFKNNIYDNRYQNIEFAKKFFTNNNDKKVFMENIIKWNLFETNNDENYDAIKYRENYCRMDCKVQKLGYECFQNMIKTICDLDILNYPTLAGLAYDFYMKEGCYDGVYQLAGTPRYFIQKCQVGGRCMTNKNEKQFVRDIIADFDGVSLYPSAMYRMEGLPKGIPKVLQPEQKNFQTLQSFSTYFIKIKILSVGIKRDFPLMSIVKEGLRHWTNELVGEYIYLSKVALEDAIKFQNIEFEIIKGYYYDEGFNTNIKEVTKKLFDERLRQKELKNPIQNVYKLILNSSYGKNGLKPVDEKLKIVNGKDKRDKSLVKYYNSIKNFVKIDNTDKYAIKMKKSIDDHFNNVHCSVLILDYSKRIMNEVMCLAQDLDIKLFYQDTDSMHILHREIKTLSDNFRLKYNRELIGLQLGQFHSDFSIIKNGSEVKTKDEVLSKCLIAVGKKSYCDILFATDMDGNEITGEHIRMKGNPSCAIKYKCEKDNMSTEQLYTNMFEGKTIEFDQTCGGDKSIFKWNKEMYWTMQTELTKKFKF